MGIDILGIDIMGVDILGIDILALPRTGIRYHLTIQRKKSGIQGGHYSP